MDFLPAEYLRFISMLEKHEVRYFLIGGIAVNIHGYSRTTEDLDIMFESKAENGQRLLAAIDDFGFDISEFTDYDFTQPIHLRIGESLLSGETSSG